ncbi:MAG: S8 family serine peptidase [Kangiellaceae bacterium]
MTDQRKSNASKAILASIPLIIASAIQPALAEKTDYLINCKADCSALIEKATSLGGVITNKYKNVNAIALTIDSDNRAELMSVQPNASIAKDKLFSLPEPRDTVDLSQSIDFEVLSGSKLNNFLESEKPEGYEFNNIITGSALMNAAGYTGAGTVVAVIDSGTANNPDLVPSIAGSVLGGENFVPGEGEPSATSTLNGAHGTWVGTMIAGHTYFLFNSASTLAQSLATHMPSSIIYDYEPGLSVVPMFGSAPDAGLYALKVFPAAGGGSPESRVIAAMDRAITMKTNYNNGMPVEPVNPGCGAEEDPCVYDSMNITVVNMSLGGGTLYAGQDLEDSLTKKMLEVGITLVASAGNEGHSAMTGGSPGTGLGSLTVGAASTVGNERVLRDIQFGLGFGELYRPSDHHQMATFSSRGPSADGRASTDVVANGFACFVQGPTGGINLVNGTSFSAPMVAGAAATLVQAFPGKQAVTIRNALKQSANPNVLGDNSAEIDQGAGFIDVPAAYNMIAAGTVDRSLPKGLGHHKVAKNVQFTGYTPINAGKDAVSVTQATGSLTPGQVAHYFIESKEETDQITIAISNFVADLPAAQQNVFFGDDLYYIVQDAETHNEVILSSGFINADETITLDNPQTGIIRLAVMGDWTNAGNVSADVTISSVSSKPSALSDKGKVAQNEQLVDEIYIPEGTTQVVFELSWANNWGAYPTDDLDLILLDPSFAAIFDGATFSSPERVVIDNPATGVWTSIIQGYTVHGVSFGPSSLYKLRVTDQDGNVLATL